MCFIHGRKIGWSPRPKLEPYASIGHMRMTDSLKQSAKSGRQCCSVKSRLRSIGEFTVRAIKPTFSREVVSTVGATSAVRRTAVAHRAAASRPLLMAGLDFRHSTSPTGSRSPLTSKPVVAEVC